MNEARLPWLDRRWVQALLIFSAMIPLLYPPNPPLIDLPGHMGRYAVALAQGSPGPLAQFYTFQWGLSGNLGLDLLVMPVAAVFGLELAVKLIIMAIPALATLGLVWISREAHGRVMPTVLLAMPLVYGYPFIYGFANYSLAMALMLIAYAFWLRLTRLGRLRLRAGLFLVIAPTLWLTHVFGWAVLCVLCGIAEIVRRFEQRQRWLTAIGQAILDCLPLAPPLVMMILWRSGDSGGETRWFGWFDKSRWIALSLRDRWLAFDLASVALMIGLTAGLLLLTRGKDAKLRYAPGLGAGAAVLLLFYEIMPDVIFGSYYADMRLFPYALMLLIVSIGTRPGVTWPLQKMFTIVCLAFCMARTAATTGSFAIAAHDYRRVLAALDHVPVGAKMVSFVGGPCTHEEGMSKLAHLPAFAIIRRQAFSNDQWGLAGAQQIRSIYPQGSDLVRYFGSDPSQAVSNGQCADNPNPPLDWALANLPRDKFDYVWLIDPPRHNARLLRGMTRIWSDPPHALYRIDDHRPLDRIPQ